MENHAGAPPLTPTIQFEDVSKIYRMGDSEVHALSHATFSIMPNEFVAISGTSGSGKSTALQLIGLLDRPTSGVIRIDGSRVDKLGDYRQTKMRGTRIGFVFQYFHLYPTLSALENVALPLRISGVGRAARKERAMELLVRVGLADRANHMPHELSGGQRQRVAIARALANRPSILLADEPTGNLDQKNGAEVLKILIAQREAGTTLVIVTHDPEIASNADRALLLRDGKVVAGA